ncbi:MAG TPA: histidine kinase dimerization/phospho-acceptor domain-containing protein, partial [Ktedonobacterales bacterium]|nr:histidine kinase dimerization/phospho-acceptor domain-containing protein [Ktedonobacterales bacterium]
MAPSARQTPATLFFWQKTWRQWPALAIIGDFGSGARAIVRRAWKSPLISQVTHGIGKWVKEPYSGSVTLIAGSILITFLVLLSRQFFQVPNLGAIYIPLIAMLAYYWRWRLAIAAYVVQLLAVYFLLLPPNIGFKALDIHTAVQLLVLAGISVYVLLLVLLARNRRYAAEREVGRFAALNTVGTALSGEMHEGQLLQLIARTACDLTGAGFAAFTLRPVDAMGQPIGPSEGSHFHLAAVVGATPAEEEMFRRVPLGGEGLLTPIFRYGVTVRVDDALALLPASHHASTANTAGKNSAAARKHVGHATADSASSTASVGNDGKERRESPRDAARRLASAYARGEASADELRTVGIPRGHPTVRSFLGAPLLDREGMVRGGLLLGHSEPGRFTKDDETLLNALAAQAAVALENTRLYHNAQSQAEELNAVFESITDGVMVYDHQGNLLHDNHAAMDIRALMRPHSGAPRGNPSISEILSRLALDKGEADRRSGHGAHVPFSLTDAHGETHEYVVSVSPLQAMSANKGLAALTQEAESVANETGGTVVVWHEVTETRKLLAEQQARAGAEAKRMLLQKVIDEQPSAVYMVRGRDARLVLANHAAQEAWGAHWAEGQTMDDFLTSSGTQVVSSGGRPLEIGELATVQAVRTGEAIRHYQEVIRRPDGTSLPVLLNAVALDPDMLGDTAPSESRPRMQVSPEHLALVVLQDVTAMKEAERVKDEFIAIAAHELKTPMAAVKGYANMLVRHTEHQEAAALEAWQVEALETIDQATNRLVELTEDLLDVARLQAERLQLHIEPHDLIALARRVMKRFQMASDRHTLSLVANDEFVVATLDVRRTEQIVGNLLS